MTVDTLAHEIHNQGVDEMQEDEDKLLITSPVIFTVEQGGIDDKKENETAMIDSGVSSMEEFGNLNVQVKMKISLILLWIRLHHYWKYFLQVTFL